MFFMQLLYFFLFSLLQDITFQMFMKKKTYRSMNLINEKIAAAVLWRPLEISFKTAWFSISNKTPTFLCLLCFILGSANKLKWAIRIATIVNIIDPDVLVLGGGMSNISRLYETVPDLVQKWTFGKEFSTPIRQAMHGDSSGVRGAAWLW